MIPIINKPAIFKSDISDQFPICVFFITNKNEVYIYI